MSNKNNHRRKNKKRKSERFDSHSLNNGYKPDSENGNLTKGGVSFGLTTSVSNRRITATVGQDFNNGHRGMAKAVKGAKKFVRTRTRFHENSAKRKLMTMDPKLLVKGYCL